MVGRVSAGFESLPLEDRAALGLVESSPHPVALPGPQRVIETELANGADGADPLRDRLPGELLPSLLEVARREVVRGILAAAGGEPLPSAALPYLPWLVAVSLLWPASTLS